MTNGNPIVPRKYLPIFIMLSSCFALWGLLNNMTDNLVPSFQKIFMTSQSTAGFVQISFYGAYSVIALLASFLIQKKGYRVGVLVGLGVYCIGALMYVPAAIVQSFWTFIVGIFVVAGGCAVLETTCNPYVLALGDESTAVRRLNFAQMFNPVGSFAGIFLAQQLILAHLNPATVAERQAMEQAALDAIMDQELFWVCVPYVAVCAVAALIWVFFFVSKPTEIDRVEADKTSVSEVLSILFHSPKWYCGVVAQVFYVGVQIAAWTWMNVYCQKELGVTAKQGASYYLIAFSLFMVCRWICTWLMKWFEPAKMMAVFALGAIAASLCVVYVPTTVLFTVAGLPFSGNVIALCSMSGFMSLMFPTIYGIGLGGIDPKAHKLGAAGLIMAIVGGALLTPWMANVIGSQMTGVKCIVKCPEYYTNGDKVPTGEMYAVIWSSDGVFEGLDLDGNPIDEKDQLVRMSPCGNPGEKTTIQFLSDVDLKTGVCALYLLDTRGADGTLSKTDTEKGTRFAVRGAQPLETGDFRVEISKEPSPSGFIKLLGNRFEIRPDRDLCTSSTALRASFFIPVICFVVVGLYALIFCGKMRTKKNCSHS